MITSILAALLVGLVFAAGRITYRLWRAGMREQQPLFMHQVLDREGVNLDGCTDEGTLTRVAAGARHCLLCRDRENCIVWLDGHSAIPLDRFCPNADLIATLSTDHRAAASSSR